MAKRKVFDDQEPIVKRGKQVTTDMVETGKFEKKEEINRINQLTYEKRESENSIGLIKAKIDFKRSTAENSPNGALKNDEEPSSLSWLVNLSAASLFSGAQALQPVVCKFMVFGKQKRC